MMTRFEPQAAQLLRMAISEVGGAEVFAIGDITSGQVNALTVTCRGTNDRVPALLDRPSAGQIVVHNHPSGDLQPSDADLALAHLYGEDGVGVVIVDNEVTRANWVVEPWQRPAQPVDEARLRAFFTRDLPAALPGWEPREQQLEMASAAATALSEDRVLLCEAGTGTGKSLAYLVPAALWALANGGRVIVSTFTKTLQSQLLVSDLPMLGRGGITVQTAVLQGRNNYLCRRRLALARAEADDVAEGTDRADLELLAGWSAATTDGSRSDLPVSIDVDLWERVMSDADLTLSVRCPDYLSCHYYRARRQAAAAHLIVVNHALLLSDLALRSSIGRGFLPKYDRVILDEAHHLEDAATGVATERLSVSAVRRAVAPLLDRRRRPGALSRLLSVQTRSSSKLDSETQADLQVLTEVAEQRLSAVAAGTALSMQQLAQTLLPQEGRGEHDLYDIGEHSGRDRQPATTRIPRRITARFARSELWSDHGAPTLRQLSRELAAAAESLDAIEALFAEVTLPEAHAQPLLDLKRARRRLNSSAEIALHLLTDDDERARWIEPDQTRQGEETAAACSAPIDVGPVLNKILWSVYRGAVATSATLTVAGRFEHLARRFGLPEDPPPVELVLPSPFDHANQALLGLPRDLPVPEDPRFLMESAAVLSEAIQISDGGAFVLCTSHAAVAHYARALRQTQHRPVLAQGDAGRDILLSRFRENRRAVLVGTDTFWEGISVRGDGLRLVIIPRIPFRVPTEPLLEARCEQIRDRGGDPFRTYTLPEAVLKLRQGYGRLIRSRTDRGAVLLLDRRIQETPYGTTLLRSLPPALRVTGPWRRVREALRELYGAIGSPHT